MSETRFTPGPWRWFVRPKSHEAYLAGDHGMVPYVLTVASRLDGNEPRMRHVENGHERMRPVSEIASDPDHNGLARLDQPDANLIAAAPDLYEALEDAIGCIMRLTDCEDLGELILAYPERYEGFRAVVEIGEEALARARGESVEARP